MPEENLLNEHITHIKTIHNRLLHLKGAKDVHRVELFFTGEETTSLLIALELVIDYYNIQKSTSFMFKLAKKFGVTRQEMISLLDELAHD